jgi:hypothetical protein
MRGTTGRNHERIHADAKRATKARDRGRGPAGEESGESAGIRLKSAGTVMGWVTGIEHASTGRKCLCLL